MVASRRDVLGNSSPLCGQVGSLVPVPLTNFTAMGLADTNGHSLANVIRAEREAKEITFELTKVYAIRDLNERNAARLLWLETHSGFSLRTNPEFNSEKFALRRERASVTRRE
jgi:hypothetical protein